MNTKMDIKLDKVLKKKKGFLQTMLDIVNESNVKVEGLQEKAAQRKVDRIIKKELKRAKKEEEEKKQKDL